MNIQIGWTYTISVEEDYWMAKYREMFGEQY